MPRVSLEHLWPRIFSNIEAGLTKNGIRWAWYPVQCPPANPPDILVVEVAALVQCTNNPKWQQMLAPLACGLPEYVHKNEKKITLQIMTPLEDKHSRKKHYISSKMTFLIGQCPWNSGLAYSEGLTLPIYTECFISYEICCSRFRSLAGIAYRLTFYSQSLMWRDILFRKHCCNYTKSIFWQG